MSNAGNGEVNVSTNKNYILQNNDIKREQERAGSSVFLYRNSLRAQQVMTHFVYNFQEAYKHKPPFH